MKTAILLLTILSFTSGSVLQGLYPTHGGTDVDYWIENTAKKASLVLGLLEDVNQVNITLDKENGGVQFRMFGLDHFNEEDMEQEVQVTRDLMNTELGRSLPGLSKYVFDEHGQYGHENEGLMLLHQLALFSHEHHNGAHTLHENGRQKRNVLDALMRGKGGKEASNRVEGVFNEDVVDICRGSLLAPHGGCSIDLAVQGSSNKCDDRQEREGQGVHQFSASEISLGCWGLCGPWCLCWPHICGDCCWHPGCNRHDGYCDQDPKSKACKWGKGIVYGNDGLRTC